MSAQAQNPNTASIKILDNPEAAAAFQVLVDGGYTLDDIMEAWHMVPVLKGLEGWPFPLDGDEVGS